MFFQQLYWEKNQNKTHFNEDISDPPLSPLEMFQKFIRFGDAIGPLKSPRGQQKALLAPWVL